MNEPKYTDAQLEKVAIRLDELVIAVADWRIEEFTMRIPAEPDRDADLVMQRAADMIRFLLSERQAAMQGQGVDKYDRVNIADKESPGARIVGFRIREGDEAWGEYGLSEPLDWLRKVTALQPPQPVRSVSDEDVRIACEILGIPVSGDDPFIDGNDVRAALERFATIAQEKQS